MPQPKSDGLDALLPPAIANRAEEIGESKARLDALSTFVLAVLAGAFIAWGAAFSTVVVVGASDSIPFGVTKLLAGLSFCLGLLLVVIAGAELFTGNNLIVMAWASGRITSWQVLRNWAIVYVGNFVGAVGIAVLIFMTSYPQASGGAVAGVMLQIAEAKCSLSWTEAIASGIGCNLLVCLAIWMCLSARSVADKVFATLFPITAFVATGMEHCVANMYFIPVGLLVKHGLKELPGEHLYDHITVENFLVNNLVPVTVGNIIGGAILVGLVYWFIYLRRR